MPLRALIDHDRLIVMEYYPARMILLDADDRIAGLAGENLAPLAQPGFPFVRGDDGRPTTPKKMGSGKFGVPHSVAIGDEGSLYFTEVAFGSRFTKLLKLPET